MYQKHAGVHGAQQRASDTLELELQVWVLGMPPGTTGRAAPALTALLVPYLFFEAVIHKAQPGLEHT